MRDNQIASRGSSASSNPSVSSAPSASSASSNSSAPSATRNCGAGGGGRILDKFTALEAELYCRKRQYQYYRASLHGLHVSL